MYAIGTKLICKKEYGIPSFNSEDVYHKFILANIGDIYIIYEIEHTNMIYGYIKNRYFYLDKDEIEEHFETLIERRKRVINEI